MNPIYLLALIRDGQLKTRDDLLRLRRKVIKQQMERYGISADMNRHIERLDHADTMFERQLGIMITHSVDTLMKEGFVEETESGFRVNPLVERLKPVLNISLAELASKPHDAIWVRPVFRDSKSPKPEHDIFVVMPFADRLAPVYADHIKRVCSNLNFSVSRADDFFSTNSVMDDVWSGISQARVVIADCTGRNPNVFYELGIAHTLGKPVVLISQDINDVPFDVRHWRCIVYEFTPRGMEKFEEQLAATLKREAILPETENLA